ncbi:MAG: 3-phosphoshikimate 1-carboxyvinyltransferase [Bacteroidales bacterium]|nr:3-phosphoshikimate 1-carboxyvinyltransferase [Bacteroidales bacterium]
MICVTISDFGLDDCKKSLRKCEKLRKIYPDIVAEIRLDLCGLTKVQLKNLFSSTQIPLIATCRKRTSTEAIEALSAGTSYLDINLMTFKKFPQNDKELIIRKNTKLILSFHDFTATPSLELLSQIYKEAVSEGADIVKIATTASSKEDVDKIFELYKLQRGGKLGKIVPLEAFAMGSEFQYTRLAAHNIGAPFIYCALRKRSVVAPGMFVVDEFEKLFPKFNIKGEIDIPASKSIAQRAIIAAILAKGTSEFHNFTHCWDIDSAVAVAKQLSPKVYNDKGTLVVSGGYPLDHQETQISVFPTMLTSIPTLGNSSTIFVGESGLLSRLCIPVLAQYGESVTISGEGSLLDRHMFGCKEVMEELGATCVLTAQETLPAIVCGPIKGGEITLSGKKGSQFISGLLMALPLCKKNSTLIVENPTSVPYIQLTIDVIKKFGIEINSRSEENRLIFEIPGKQKYKPAEFTFEGDWSSAANFVIIGAIYGDVLLKGLNLTSLQADKKIIDVVRKAGAIVERKSKGIRVRMGHLSCFDVDVTNCPDLLPGLSIMAALSEGTSHLSGVARLKNKESDRPLIMTQILNKMGVEAELDGDTLHITGISMARRILENNMLKGGYFRASSDHRVAMALKIASIACKGEIKIDNTDCIDKSFPEFLTIFDNILTKE